VVADQVGEQLLVTGTGPCDKIARGKYERQGLPNRRRGRFNSGEGVPRQFQTLPPRS
jgi:hypothetical protein